MSKNPVIAVTDHAVLRWLERAAGIDVAAVRTRIAEDCAPAAAVGACSIYKDGMTYCLRGLNVVTVLPGKQRGVTGNTPDF